MTKQELFNQITQKSSYLCVGLDTDLNRIPKHLLKAEDPLFEFNKQIIDATIDYAIAYKPNIAFYEAHGVKGWESLQKTIEYIPKEAFTIADAKRGDIGNTSNMYARAFFDAMNFDSITVAPYMGEDSVKPFLEFDNKWVILLALTSNAGGKDFQNLSLEKGGELYEEVLRKSQEWGSDEELMYVVGATRAEALQNIRKIVPDHFLLVPGVGAQGGSLEEVSKYGMNKHCGLLVNSSRGIIYADDSVDFAKTAGVKAQELQAEMEGFLAKFL
ncbi:orotidine-5'-phosphate decarboxylase [Roseivirga pacifica]|uniref:orotidine-5'-phosphate decarboxylase n=1 Tax=Roseivirga pacifica TaxID=1267423 RepID=UPI002094A3A2|nr:orotidine-5'-phosphate decarboxylase [Roseivirga pacifica]MCO6358126.1 orotidine-5'-phosphate decarboxylase [Roseivirga pacifica]MCO6366564.1 orotidine-5'-phosphate decarboxylase [Roseivirga pacifica]MCO6371049.1 orotidine-5'-phosphate decarboxylase [Roseivirga pacifica]MCO6373857.1 orotidine-5'-phosphate decarboxylase [Roseivirga pacifica]MCO6380838.1 orotidine-5'-phosphate decarboxylase [Roseivirga pacifica]